MVLRRVVKERPEWREKNASIGFDYDMLDGVPYWNEEVCYEFSLDKIEILEAATMELHGLCLELVDKIVRNNWFERLQIPPWFGEVITQSWERSDPTLYGRFDLAYDGVQPPKLLEYNSDTPTSLLESSLGQWNWLKEQAPQLPNDDQFNSIHERLIDAWKETGKFGDPNSKLIHFAYLDCSLEDYRNVEYLMDTAAQAGFEVEAIPVQSIGSNGRHFFDLQMRKISRLFKLYPYEWMQNEKFGPVLARDPCLLLEPPWKSVLSNKTVLALMWECFPDHPNLLPAVVEGAPSGDVSHYWANGIVRKPLYGREGANVAIRTATTEVEKEGPYGYEGFLLQAYAPLMERDGHHAVLGSWIIGDEPAGLCVREDTSPIMSNISRFCPHYLV